MRKNQRGFGAMGYIFALLLAVVIGVVGLNIYRHQKTKPAGSTTTKQPAIQDKQASKVTNDDQLTVNHNQDNTAKDYPKPTAPTGLKVTPWGSGYNLTWNASVSTSLIANYQVFYQGNMIAEPTTTTFRHNLPPPPPGCKPIPLTYYVKAIDNDGSFSLPSDSVTLQFSGC